jgi:hypothetical protein
VDDGERELPADLDAKIRWLAQLTKRTMHERAELERRVRARLEGWRPVDDVLSSADRADTERRNGGSPYPASWSRAADEARKVADAKEREGGRLGGRAGTL